ncbi:hypothetical protein J4470_05575 [Candidatus Woesearchaeota archaeon]|nr:hypothetical protein [Candidatus Woesearchaeota archaeon]
MASEANGSDGAQELIPDTTETLKRFRVLRSFASDISDIGPGVLGNFCGERI